MQDSGVTIRIAVHDDIPKILELCKSVDRVLAFDEIMTFMQLDPGAIIVAEHPEDRKVIGTCSGMRHGSSLGFMGLFMVHNDYRKRGIGKRLWNRALTRLENLNVGVRGDYINFQNYKKQYNFQYVADYLIAYYECFDDSKIRNIVKQNLGLSLATFFQGELVSVQKDNDKNRLNSMGVTYSGVAIDNAPLISADISKQITENNATVIPSCRSIDIENKSLSTLSIESDAESLLNTVSLSNTASEIPNVGVCDNIREASLYTCYVDASKTAPSFVDQIINSIVDYDRRLHRRDRSFLVRQTLSWESCRCKVAIGSGSVIGYGCLRPSVTSVWIVSPLYADSEDIAEVLLRELLHDFDFRKAPRGVQIRFPFHKKSSCEFLNKMGFTDTGIRITTGYTKECIDIETSKIFSFHSTVFCSE